MHPHFKPFVPIRHVGEWYSALKAPLLKTWGAPFFSALEEFSKLELGFVVPEEFWRHDPELWEALTTARRCIALGIIDGFQEITRQYPDEPNILQYYMQVSGATMGGQSGSGFHFFSRAAALWAAIGEAIERYALLYHVPEKKSVDASYNELTPSDALDIFSLVGIAPEQRRRGHPQFNLRFDEHTRFRWVPGWSLTRQKKTLVPLQLASFGYTAPLKGLEPLLLMPVSTGAAAHRSLSAALLNGLLEVIERDAFMITWLNALTPPRIDYATLKDESLQKICALLKRYRLDFFLLPLPSDMPVHTILALILDSTGVGPAVSVGAKSSGDLVRAVQGALTEAIACRSSVRRYYMENPAHQKGSAPTLDPKTLDREGRLRWWSTIDKIKEIQFLVTGELVSAEASNRYPRHRNDEEALRYLVEVLKSKKHEVVYVEMLDPRLRAALQFHAVMVIVPGLQPLHLFEGLPYVWGDRLDHVPQELGLRQRGVHNTLPHPFP